MREDVEIEINEKEHEGYLTLVKGARGVLIKEFNEMGHEHGRVFIYWEEMFSLMNELEEEAERRGGGL